MPSDMDRPMHRPRDFSKSIARFEISVRNTISGLFRRRRRLVLFILGVVTIFTFWRLIRPSKSSFSDSHTITPISVPVDHGAKYFHESTNDSHLDIRFSHGTAPHTTPPPLALQNLIRSFILTTRTLNVTPWLAHGTLLGWFWGHAFLPWDTDIDTHLSFQDLNHLATHYNNTKHEYEEYSTILKTYLLDINPYYIDRTENRNSLDNNRIDARWIDTSSGLFIDITSVEVFSEDVLKGGGKQKGKAAQGKKFLRAKDGHSYEAKLVYPLQQSFFEGVDCFVPQAAAVLLAQEYGNRALTARVFRGFKFDDKEQRWVLISRITKEQ